MSEKYPGGIIRSTPVTPAGPYQDSAASGIWTLDQATNFIKQGNWPTAGNVNPNAFIENLFSTYLYTGNGSTQTITNGIDLAGQGGLIWTKRRNTTGDNWLNDTTRGISRYISSNLIDAELGPDSNSISSVSSTGYSVGFYSGWNANSSTYVSWTFRKQPKFFDVVTYTGNGSVRTIAHNLGSVPGCIIVKKTSGADNWFVQHRSLGSTQYIALNDADIAYTNSQLWNDTDPTSSVFTLGTNSGVNQSGATYVAYLFAHNAGGFGLTGTDNVISCGSVTGSAVVNLGYEPQWVLSKCAGSAGQDWTIVDNMRGAPTPASGNTPYSSNLMPNLSNAENTSGTNGASVIFNSTGFRLNPDTTVATTYIYIAIRRGPMKTPTTGTSVFDPEAYTGTSATRTITSGFPVDLSASKVRSQGYPGGWFDRLRGALQVIRPELTDAEATSANSLTGFDSMTGVVLGSDGSGRINTSPETYAMWNFRRAPGFFDVVCYTGTGSATTFNHNLGVVPEMMIVKRRSSSGSDWWVYNAPRGATKSLRFTDEAEFTLLNIWNNTAPTSSVFTVGADSAVNGGSSTYVWYGFASCPGVSKVGSYTGTGALQTINCGFTGGARFVLIKRTDSTGDWFTYDSARGITSGNDPYLLMNSTAAEVTGTNYVDTTSVGFQVTAAAPAGLNANGGTYIFLAIA